MIKTGINQKNLGRCAKYLWSSLLFLCLISLSYGQRQEGTRFWLAFMEHVDQDENRKKLYITARKKSNGIIKVPAIGWEKEFTIPAGGAIQVEVPREVETLGSERTGDLSILVTSTEPVSVYAHQFSNARSDAALILPESSLGKDYVAVTYQGHFEEGKGYPAEFLVLATHNNTDVYIHPTSRTYRNRGPGRPINIKLNKGETYQVQASHYSNDFTGSRITSNKPVALFSGNQWTQVPQECRAPDNLFTQVYPMESAGKEFIVCAGSVGSFEVVRIIAATTGTEVYIDGQYKTSLFEGEFWETTVSGDPIYIRTSKPALVARYLTGYACAPKGEEMLQSDPSLVMVNHLRQSVQEAVFWAPSQARIAIQDVEMVVREEDMSSVRVDGNTVSGFKTVPGQPAYRWARVRVGLGKHTIQAGGCGVAAYIIGYGRLESYAFPIGTGFSLFDTQAKGLIPEGGCLADTFTFLSQIDSSLAETVWDMGDGTQYAQPVVRHGYSEPGIYQVELQVHNRCLGISDTLRGDIVISPPLKVKTMRDTLICAGDTLRLKASLTPGADYAWTGPSNFFSTGQFPIRYCPDSSYGGIYTVIATTKTGCYSEPGRVKIMIRNIRPELGPDTALCAGDTFLLAAPLGWTDYQWQDGSSSPFLTVRQAGNFLVEVKDGYGCKATDSVSVVWKCPPTLFLPGVFSPNDDKRNDIFQPIIDILKPKFYQFQVYDSAANVVFQTRNILNGWDGSDRRGRPLPPGMYQWTVYFEEHPPDLPMIPFKQTGWVKMVR